MDNANVRSIAEAAIKFARQAERLSLLPHDDASTDSANSIAVEAKFITSQDPVIITADGGRLPTVPLAEARNLNHLKEELERKVLEIDPVYMNDGEQVKNISEDSLVRVTPHETTLPGASLGNAVPPPRTNPLFPDLPLYGPPSVFRNFQYMLFRCSSAVLSLAFLGVIVLGATFMSIPLMLRQVGLRLIGKDPNAGRPFHIEEKRNREIRRQAARIWTRDKRRRNSMDQAGKQEKETEEASTNYTPTEGGPDPVICDVHYYARRVGLDVEEFEVQTEDGFIIVLWHIFNPREYRRLTPEHRRHHSADIFVDNCTSEEPRKAACGEQYNDGNRRYPILLIHGLLQSGGAYCTNDDASLAFFLCKSGYDVWVGNNRCGFSPKHTMLQYHDPRMWCWNIRQMGVMDLPALISRVLSETGFQRLGLICHSQGTTETFVALAKEQRPDLGKKISVFCALAPAVYAGPLIQKMYFKFLRIISPGMFRVFFGIHSFIPFMMAMHSSLPGRIYGVLGYRVFSFLFNWSDDRWDQGLRDRMFQFAPVYVSAESMRWWLGRECFAKQKCILSTREENCKEDDEDEEDEQEEGKISSSGVPADMSEEEKKERGRRAWYDEQVPPFALWIAGNDALVDGRRLLRRFEKGREPHVRVVHAKVIEEYEHLDVIWAMDMIEKVGKEVRQVIWKTASMEERKLCRLPTDCEEVELWN